MVKEHKFGKMEASTQDTGNMIKQMEKEDSFMQMEMPMKVTGIMIKLKAEVPMNMLMEQNMLVTGKKIDNMDMVLKHGPTMQNTKEIMNMERSMVSVHSNGLMAHPT